MKKIAIEIKWGILFSIATLAWMIVEKSVGLHDVYISKQSIYTNLFGIIAIIIYALAIREKKNVFFQGSLSWRQGFISGVVLSIVIAVLSPIVQYITYTYISPDFFTNITRYAVEKKVLTPEQAAINFSLNSYMLQGVFGSLSMGVITAAIVAFFIKNKD